ncbi:hypothetical protein FHG87_000008 [Trinorchestia longiramus]|nr:hypothetical protein FHG87_000008 [Trinorchestia longiramus]
MAKLTIIVFLLAAVAQAVLAQPVVDVNVNSVGDVPVGDNPVGDVLAADEIGLPSDGEDVLPNEDLSDNEVDQAFEEILSRVRRGFGSRLKRAWKKHVRPALKKAVTAHVVKTYVVPAVASLG